MYTGKFYDDLVRHTENAAKMMYDFFNLKLQGKNK